MTAPDYAALPLRELILDSLAEAASIRREFVDFCTDCRKSDGGLCPDHRDDSALAADYEAAYMQVRGTGSDGTTLTGGLT